MSEVKQNIRIRFSKRGDIRFISHHDLMRLFERALRRAGLPVAMSEGYNPRPRMSFPIALSVGFSGENEVADIGLSEWVRPDEVRWRLQAEFPRGIEILSTRAIPRNPNREPAELSYRIPLRPRHTLTEERVRALLSHDRVVVHRKRKDRTTEVQIRQFIKAIRLEGGLVFLLLRYTESGTARPQEVLDALGCREGVDYLTSEIERTHVRLASPV